MKSAMIDIETISTRSDAAVLSVGVAVFDEGALVATDGWAIDPKYISGHIDIGTVAWWMQQNEAAKEFSWKGAYNPSTMAFLIKTMLATNNVEEYWANDPNFDLVILENWWNRLNNEDVLRHRQLYTVGDWPMNFRQYRSFRTIVAECNRLGYENVRNDHQCTGVAHNPIDDAAGQARVVIAARQYLSGIPR